MGMRKWVYVVFLIVLCAILALGSCAAKKSYAAEIADLNGTWQPDWSYQAALELPEEEKGSYLSQRKYSWGSSMSIPNTTFDIDITDEEPFILAPGDGAFYITEITQTGTDIIKVNATSATGWSIEVVFHFVDKDTLWIESKIFDGSQYGKDALWHRLSGPERQE
jgi:hypothetical protein